MNHYLLKIETINKIRRFFEAEGLIEAFTPVFVKSSAIEPFVEGFTFRHKGSAYSLPTSPEINLKKVLAQYHNPINGIFEIAHAFRDDPVSETHLHEFTMAEWYMNNCHYHDLSTVIQRLIQSLSEEDYSDIKVFSFAELAREATGRDVEPDWGWREYADLLHLLDRKVTFMVPSTAEAADILTIELISVFTDQIIQAALKKYHLAAVYDFSPYTRGMARLNSNGFAERIEFFMNGTEIANGYSEESDPEEILKLWRQTNRIRNHLGKHVYQVDENLLEITEQMNGVAGAALGVERLLMKLNNTADIRKFTLT